LLLSPSKEGALRLYLLICVALVTLAITATASARKRWPDPPGWWLHSTYMTCVRWNESQNGSTSRNIYEMEGPNATASDGDYEWLYGAPRAEQNYLAWLMWKRSGCHQPWGKYDGCC
jgi:hypothetical protein